MGPTDHHVIFRFQLTPALAAGARAAGRFATPRGVCLARDDGGTVTLASIDHLQSYAIRQVLDTAAAYLRAIGADAGLSRLRAALSTPATRAAAHAPGQERPIVYLIALGARVSITRVLIEEEPTLLADAPELFSPRAARAVPIGRGRMPPTAR